MNCNHLNFQAEVSVTRIAEKGDGPITAYVAEIHVSCADCGQPFRFKCPVIGMSPTQPAVSIDGQELRCPIEPSDGTVLPGLSMGFEISAKPGSSPSDN
jgi:hypothetical protein